MTTALALLCLAMVARASVISFADTETSMTRNFHVHSEPLYGNQSDASKRPFVDFEGVVGVVSCQ